mmetsp:Transcript_53528/g.130805  ORF Transcript_53528/g.130805 Transcript_53528/m.130805 type:complete len:277 (-) Transcript_53528:563-1393(-)
MLWSLKRSARSDMEFLWKLLDSPSCPRSCTRADRRIEMHSDVLRNCETPAVLSMKFVVCKISAACVPLWYGFCEYPSATNLRKFLSTSSSTLNSSKAPHRLNTVQPMTSTSRPPLASRSSKTSKSQSSTLSMTSWITAARSAEISKGMKSDGAQFSESGGGGGTQVRLSLSANRMPCTLPLNEPLVASLLGRGENSVRSHSETSSPTSPGSECFLCAPPPSDDCRSQPGIDASPRCLSTLETKRHTASSMSASRPLSTMCLSIFSAFCSGVRSSLM